MYSLEQGSGGSRISLRWGRQLPGGAPTYDFAKNSQKLHEIERIWAGGAHPKFYYVDPPLQGICRGITLIHRSPSRPTPMSRPSGHLINIHVPLIYVS